MKMKKLSIFFLLLIVLLVLAILMNFFPQIGQFHLIFILIVAEMKTLTEEDLGHLDGCIRRYA